MRKGSITPYLALTFAVLLSLILVCLSSAGYACGRAVLSAGMDEGLFSLFSEYDRTLYEKYGLLFIDSGFSGSEPDYGRLLEETCRITEDVIYPSMGIFGIMHTNMYRIRLDHRAVTGVVLATDYGYAPLKEQIYSLMAAKKGVDAVVSAVGRLTGAADSISAQEETGTVDMDALQAEYEREKAEAAAAAEEEPEGTGQTQSPSVTVPENFVNPIDTIRNLQKLGIYSFVVPDPAAVSDAAVEKKTLLGSRSLNEGFGIGFDYRARTAEKFMMIEYLMDFFPSFLSAGNTEGLQYQAEYAVAGKYSDVSNLKSVMNRIMLIREGFNLLYLNTNAVRRMEAFDIALIITAIFCIPEAAPLVSELVMVCWAYGESLMDLKALYEGKKVPLFKDDDTWQLSLTNLSGLSAADESSGRKAGLTYRDYLRIMMILMPEDRLMTRIAELLEYNKRLIDNEPHFRLDNCVYIFEAELGGTVYSREVTIRRSFGYDR